MLFSSVARRASLGSSCCYPPSLLRWASALHVAACLRSSSFTPWMCLACCSQYVIHRNGAERALFSCEVSLLVLTSAIHTHPWRHPRHWCRASSPAVRTAAGLIQPSCRKRVRRRAVTAESSCAMRYGGAGGCCVVVSASLVVSATSLLALHTAAAISTKRASERARMCSRKRAAANP